MGAISVQLITKELMLACRQLGHVISETLSALIVSTVVNPNSGSFYVEKPIDETDARTVIEDAAKKILSKEQPGINCLRLQAAYDGTFAEIDRELQKRTSESGAAEDHLVGSISGFEAKFDQDFDTLTGVYKKIYQFLLLRCTHPIRRATPPKDPLIEREVAAALESVFPRVGLRAFVALTGPEKAAQLQELASIVLGIRLFNQHQGRGGTGLPTIRGALAELGAEELLGKVQKEIEEANEVCKHFSDYLKASKVMKIGAKGFSEAEIERAKIDSFYHRQYLSYLLSLEEDLAIALEKVQKEEQHLDNELAHIGTLVGGRVSVPKEQVYPRFDALTRLYHSSWREVQALEARARLLNVLVEFKRKYYPSLLELQQEAMGLAAQQEKAEEETLSHIEELEAIPGPSSTATGAGPTRVTADNHSDFLQVALDYQGFCIHTLVTQDGMVVPGNPALGVIKHADRCSVFASERAAVEFCADPDSYYNGVRQACYKYPELIQLLGMHKDFPSSSLQTILRTIATTSAVVQADVGTSTPLHFEETNIDKSYQWNEWKLRSNALQMADIKKKATSTTQTALSHLRRENETQVYLPKETATNTNVNSGTNPIRWRRYMRGLRGEPQPMTIVEEKFDL